MCIKDKSLSRAREQPTIYMLAMSGLINMPKQPLMPFSWYCCQQMLENNKSVQETAHTARQASKT